jgi:hypothetical protein
MRRYLLFFSAALVLALSFPSCTPIADFDESLLYGKWVDTYREGIEEYYRFDLGGTGVTWWATEEVTEDEAQEFTWSLEGADFTIIHIMEMGGTAVPKAYTMKTLTATDLKFEDYTGKIFSYSKTTE